MVLKRFLSVGFLLLCVALTPFMVSAVTTTSQIFNLELSGGHDITSIVVSNHSDFSGSKTYTNGQSIKWDLCYQTTSCNYGAHTVYVHFIASDGSLVDVDGNGSTTLNYNVTYKQPVVVKKETTVETVVTPSLLPETIVLEQPQEPIDVAVVQKQTTAEALQTFLSAPETQKVLTTTAKSAGFIQAMITILATLAPTLSGPSLILLPFRLWNLILVVVGLRKRITPWGTVFDSLTKQPLDPVVVSLKNEEGKEVATSITDIDGRYGFFTEPGNYTIEVNKTNYVFPSQILMGQKYDSIYENLYHGESLPLNQDAIITKNLPMDPNGTDWNQQEKARMHRGYTTKFMQVLAQTTNTLFIIGLLTSIVSLLTEFNIVNIALVAMYAILFIARRIGFKPRIYGNILAGGKPVKNAILRIWGKTSGVQIAKAVADDEGHYYALVPKGEYLLSVEVPDGRGNFKPLVSGLHISGKNGFINSKIELPVT